MRELEANDLFLKPDLVFVRTAASPVAATEPYDFSIKVNMRPPKTAEEDDGYDDQIDQGGSE